MYAKSLVFLSFFVVTILDILIHSEKLPVLVSSYYKATIISQITHNDSISFNHNLLQESIIEKNEKMV